MKNYVARKSTWLARLAWVWVLLAVFAVGAGAPLAFTVFPSLSTLVMKLTPFGEKASKTVTAASEVNSGESIGTVVATMTSTEVVLMLFLISASGAFALRNRKAVAAFLYERLFDTFNNDVFDPIRPPAGYLAGDQALPWLAPADGKSAAGRLELWSSLEEWVHAGAHFQSSDPDAVPFSWALLVGRPGSGKSRTADEMAQLLARSDLRKDATERANWRTKWRRLRLSVGVTWRRALRRSTAQDPWDVARPAHQRGGSGSELLQNAVAFTSNFDAWRPRAPTLIVFEDPRFGEVASLIQLLATKTAATSADMPVAPYKFPVRLLVVNQTIPADLKLMPVGNDRWSSALPHLTGGPWVMTEQNYFTWAEWLDLKRQLFAPDDKRGFAVTRSDFSTVTRDGHPLLVEALMAWLTDHPEGVLPVVAEELTPELLLADRAQRVLKALQTAGIDGHKAWRLLAAASLVGGIRGREGAALQAIDRAAIQRVFASEDVQYQVPAVRPDLIGHAFAELVVCTPVEAGVMPPAVPNVQEQTAKDIATLAWQADPYAVLEALAKLMDRNAVDSAGTTGGVRQLLKKALEQATHEPGSAKPEDIARAFVRHHLAQGCSLEAVRSWIQNLRPTIAHEIATTDLFDLGLRESMAARDLLAVFSLAAARALDEERSPELLLIALERLARELAPRGNVPLGDHVPVEGFARLGSRYAKLVSEDPAAEHASPSTCRRLFGALWLGMPVRAAVLRPFSKACAAAAPLFSALSWEARAAEDSLWAGGEFATSFEAEVLELCRDSTTQQKALSAALGLAMRAHAYGGFGTAQSAAHAEQCAVRIQQLASSAEWFSLQTKRELAEWAAEAWTCAANAHCGSKTAESAVRAENCAIQIQKLTVPFGTLPPDERLLLIDLQAQALSLAANAAARLSNAANGAALVALAERCALQIQNLSERQKALPLRARRILFEALAETWASARRTHSESQALGRETYLSQCIARIQDVAVQADLLSASERRVVIEKLVGELSAMTWLFSQSRESEDGAKAEQFAKKTQDLVQALDSLPLCERRYLAEYLAQAWACAAVAHSHTGTAEGAMRAERCAARIQEVVRPFFAIAPEERFELMHWLAQAWGAAAYAHGETGTVDGAKLAERCAARIHEAARPFDSMPLSVKSVFGKWLAIAWAHAAGGYLANDAAETERCAKQVDSVIQPFRSQNLLERLELVKWQSAAWGFATLAYTKRADARNADRCRTTVLDILMPLQLGGVQLEWMDTTRRNAGLLPPASKTPSTQWQARLIGDSRNIGPRLL